MGDKAAFWLQVDEAHSEMITEVTGAVLWAMWLNKITHRELAAQMDVGPGRLTQMLSGRDFTLRDLATLTTALATLAAARGGHFELNPTRRDT